MSDANDAKRKQIQLSRKEEKYLHGANALKYVKFAETSGIALNNLNSKIIFQ